MAVIKTTNKLVLLEQKMSAILWSAVYDAP
jgi:hypothetical protein